MQRRVFNIRTKNLESTQFKNNMTPLAKCVSGQRLQLVRCQEESQLPPIIGAEFPLVESTMAQEMMEHSSSIKKHRSSITLLGKFRYQDLTLYFYKTKGMVHVLKHDGYMVYNGFAYREKTDLEDLELNVEYDVSDDKENFLIKYPTQYNPATRLIGYGANVTTVISTVRANALDAIDVSESFIHKFAALRDKTINISLTKKKIISSYPDIFPPLGEFLDNPTMFKIVRDDNKYASLAQNPLVTAGYEDDAIILEPLSYINRIEVFCNRVIEDPILEKLRSDLQNFRQEVYEFINNLKDPYDEWVDAIRGNYGTTKKISGNQDIKDPLIILHTKTVSIPETESKFNVDPVHSNMCLKSVLKAGTA